MSVAVLISLQQLQLPSFDQLRMTCSVAIKQSPNRATVEKWLALNRLTAQSSASLEQFQSVFMANGFTAAEIEQSASSLSFFTRVRGALVFETVAHGYFLFTNDGSLVNYKMDEGTLGF